MAWSTGRGAGKPSADVVPSQRYSFLDERITRFHAEFQGISGCVWKQWRSSISLMHVAKGDRPRLCVDGDGHA
jgi:hypothetical protein